MLESLRRSRRLQDWVAALFTALVLVAMFSGVRVRAALPPQMASVDICSASIDLAHAEHTASSTVQSSNAALETEEHSGASHHGPDCLLCVSIAPPDAAPLVRYQPPRSASLTLWRFLPSSGAENALARAPLPPRGPPSDLA